MTKFVGTTLTLLLLISVTLAQHKPGQTVYQPNQSGNYVQGYPQGGLQPQVSDGHRMITRALWRIFDALMEKKEQVKRMTQVEAALKTMITADTKIDDEVRKLRVCIFSNLQMRF